MKRSLSYTVCLAATLSVMTMEASWSSFETEAQIAGAVGSLAPSYHYAATDPIRIIDIDGPSATELDNARLSAPTFVPGSDTYWDLSVANDLRVLASIGSHVRTFKAALGASWAATTTVTLTEDVRDGASGPGSAYTLSLILTKTGAVADLTRAALYGFLGKTPTKTFAASNAGTALVAGSTALSAGWAAKAYFADSASTAVAGTLDPLAVTIGMTVTPSVGAAISYKAALSNFYDWNVVPASGTAKNVLFTTDGRFFKISAYPGLFPLTAGPATNLLAAISAMPVRISQTNLNFLQGLPDAVNELLTLMDTSAPVNAKLGLNKMAKAALGSSNIAIGDFTTVADSSKIGLVSLTPADINNVTWTVNGPVITAMGKIGSGVSKAFICDLNGIQVAKAGTHDILEFASKDGDAFWAKIVDATGYDESANALGDPSSRDDALAIELHGKLTTLTSIASIKLIPLLTASQS